MLNSLLNSNEDFKNIMIVCVYTNNSNLNDQIDQCRNTLFLQTT